MNPVPFTTLAAAMDFVVGDRNYPLSELFMKGGFIMWPLLLLSIAGVVVLVMCCFSTRASGRSAHQAGGAGGILHPQEGLYGAFPSFARMGTPATRA